MTEQERFEREIEVAKKSFYERQGTLKAEPICGMGKSPDTLNQSAAGVPTMASPPERIALHNIDAAMTYQPWGYEQKEAGNVVREALTAAAKAILRSVPASRFRDTAIDAIIEARMHANAAISFRGRF